MPTYYTDEHGTRYEVRRDENFEAYLVPADGPQPSQAEPAFEKPARTWAEAYRVSNCGNCNRADCPRCAQKFLDFLHGQGKRPAGP